MCATVATLLNVTCFVPIPNRDFAGSEFNRSDAVNKKKNINFETF